MAVEAAPTGPCRLAYLYASPLVHRHNGYVQEVDALDTTLELDVLQRVLQESRRVIGLRAEVATSANLRKLVTLGCRMLHYTGHGMPDCLAFENGRGELHPLEVQVLKRLFQAGGVSTQMVFVSACHSEIAGRAFVDAGVDHVVAVRWNSRVTDQSSRIFAQSFYLALLVGRTVRQAFDIGCAAVAAAPDVPVYDEPQFLLLPEHGAHDVPIFPDAEAGAWVDETPPLPLNTCPPGSPYFMGRNMVLQELYSFFVAGVRCVSLVGTPGIGKTSVAVRAADYCRHRREFEAIYFVALDEVSADGGEAAGAAGAEAGGDGTPVQGGDPSPKGTPVPLRKAVASAQPQEGGADTPVAGAAAMGTGGDFCVPRVAQAICAALQLPPVDSDAELFAQLAASRFLLVLDGCDEHLGSSGGRFSQFVTALLRNTHNLVVLITAERSIHSSSSDSLVNEGEKVVEVRPLADQHAASLFAKLAPRNLRYEEMGAAHTTNKAQALDALASTPVLRMLGGHPRAIAMMVRHLESSTLPELENRVSEVYERAIMRQGLEKEIRALCASEQAVQVWLSVCAGQRSVPWHRLAGALEAWAAQACAPAGGGDEPPRPLDDAALAFLRERLGGAGEDPVSLDRFAAFSHWFLPTLNTMTTLGPLWTQTSPLLVHGLITRRDAERLLAGHALGTFLFRCSAKYAGWLAASFVTPGDGGAAGAGAAGAGGGGGCRAAGEDDDPEHTAPPTRIMHCLVEVRGPKSYVMFYDDGAMSFQSLTQLVHECRAFSALVPGIAKREAFR